MKQNNKVATLRPPAPSTDDGKQTGPSSAGTNAEAVTAGTPRLRHALDDHAGAMSRGEISFLLRDVHRYWSTPHMSYEEIEHLEQQHLIQRSVTGICAIRLTDQGARVKNCE